MQQRKPPRDLRATIPVPYITTDSLNTGSAPAMYFPQLARFRGDPEAYVSSKSEIASLIRSRGWRAEGVVDVDALELTGPPERYTPAPDIVEREVRRVVKRDHGGKVDRKKRAEIREAVTERLSGTQD